ncbi:DUF3427 domain-containing protein [Nosocomiicoccus ampullae]|uniref:Superfamily II DNA or RNA helicase n=1 Tax=Nosocomiicoccus ampullae TaxID=489910 RepID=A0A9Q2D0B4_9STAP|nr:DUF3427 domain-containing protein [Nosocomiicoccus ampullae]MBB5176222.1 superfamily II DNA or RNA helicase [Nosocomiicoccus ampullae]QYA47386.1 DUF3427 domain-containing protein [Nosocomiicoccus ampullae]
MSYERFDNDSIIHEAMEEYKTTSKYLLNKKLLSNRASIEYFHNKHEAKTEDEIQQFKNNTHYSVKDLVSYMNERVSGELKTFPLALSLYGNEYLDAYKYELTDDFQLMESKLIVNDHSTGDFLLNHLKNELLTCSSFDIIVSFVRGSGLNLLINTLDLLREYNIKGRIITTTYMNVTEPAAMRVLNSYENIELKVYESSNPKDSFHTKGYIFHRDNNYGSVIIGSSNISEAALKTGEEWNVRTYERASDSIYDNMSTRFERLWNHDNTVEATDAYINKYAHFLETKNILTPIKSSFNSKLESRDQSKEIIPNSMQMTAIKNMLESINEGYKRGLAIAATGTGKTFLSAMCAKELNPKNVLFIAHRIELLNGAKETFKTIFKNDSEDNFKIYKGSKREVAKFTFASIQTLINDYEKFNPNDFDLIVIDEFHHGTSPTYKAIIDHFTPNFLLGLTATPDRTDGGNIYELSDYNIIVDVRLQHALESELLVPFQYYGISDRTIDLAGKDDINENELVKILNTNRRVDFIVEKMNQYILTDTRKCLAFCQNIEHAEYMNTEFQKRGFYSTVLTGKDNDNTRSQVIKKLEDDNHPLEIIFIVDLFNEGVDIPKVNLILFLRPTESAIIFTQQLGRGLRKAEDKEYLTVLDFVTNSRNNYLIPIALNGNKEFIDKQKLKNSVKKNFVNLSNSIHIELDHISKERILQSIDTTDFMKAEFIQKDARQFLEVIRLETKNDEKKLSIMDFYSHEQAPSLSRLFKGTYKNLSILNKRIKAEREVDKEINESKQLTFIMDQIMKAIPVKVLYDPIIFILILLNKKLKEREVIHFLEDKLKVKLNNQAKEKIHYAFVRTSKINYKKKRFFNYEDGVLNSKYELSNNVQKELKEFLEFIQLSYRQNYPENNLNYQNELLLYEQYSRSETLALIGYDKDINSLREGVLQYKGDHYLFVNLDKNEKTVEEHLLYDDYFISQYKFHWQSQNQTHENTPTGQQYIHHKKNDNKIHLFVRRENSEDKLTLPFYYLGEVEYESHEGGKPMSIIWNFKQPVPKDVMDDLES